MQHIVGNIKLRIIKYIGIPNSKIVAFLVRTQKKNIINCIMYLAIYWCVSTLIATHFICILCSKKYKGGEEREVLWLFTGFVWVKLFCGFSSYATALAVSK